MDHFERLKNIFKTFTYLERSSCGPNFPIIVFFGVGQSKWRFSVRYDAHEDKYCVHGDWPEDLERTTIRPESPASIKVSASRTDEAILKDFMNRFYNEFSQQYTECMNTLNQNNEQITRKRSLRKSLALALGSKFDPERHDFSWDEIRDYNYCVWKIRMGYTGEKVDMELRSVPGDVAKEVIELLKKRVPE